MKTRNGAPYILPREIRSRIKHFGKHELEDVDIMQCYNGDMETTIPPITRTESIYYLAFDLARLKDPTWLQLLSCISDK